MRQLGQISLMEAMHSSSLNICRRMKTEDVHYSLRIVEGRGLDYGTKVVDNEGGNAS